MGEMGIEELVRWSAEGLMGWHIKVCNYHINSKPAKTEYFYNWFNKRIIKVKDWHPDDPKSPTEQILMVIEKMREKGWFFKLEDVAIIENGEIWIARFTKAKAPTFTLSEGDYGVSKGKDPCLATLRAAHAAWQEGEGGQL